MGDLKAISIFTGAGGLDYGFETAGFDISVAVENDGDCYNTLRANREWPIINSDINRITSKDILNEGGLNPGDVDLLIGGPPCQPFSKSAYWANGNGSGLRDPRSDTLNAFMRCVNDLLPEVFLIENVHGIKYSGKEEGFNLLQNLTNNINKNNKTKYKIFWKVINTADYGVPQTRTRLFLVAHREGKTFKFPSPTHSGNIENNNKISKKELQPHITAWDAIGGLKLTSSIDLTVRGRWADLLPSIPEGQNYLWHTNRKEGKPIFGWRTRYWSFLLKLAKNRPSWTIQAQPGGSTGPFHWNNRLLSIEEMSRIQTFPKDIEIVGNRGSIQKQIGNAVPSLMSEILGKAILEQFFNVKINDELKLAVKRKKSIPPPEPVLPVPKKYLTLIGEHPDHPGVGKGPGKLKV